MVKHNNVVPNVHFRKDWERHVYTWFHQAPQKKARRLKRQKKAARIFPRPASGLLRPIVRCPTQRYNIKQRQGYGFTHLELKKAGVNVLEARNIGISVDHRRRNKTHEGFENNVDRLKQYLSKLVIFPKRASRSKARALAAKAKKNGEPIPPKPTKPELPAVEQHKGPLLPIKKPKPSIQWRPIKPHERKGLGAYATLRLARSEARNKGRKDKIAKEKAADITKQAAIKPT